jgi:hypothetical protein
LAPSAPSKSVQPSATTSDAIPSSGFAEFEDYDYAE